MTLKPNQKLIVIATITVTIAGILVVIRSLIINYSTNQTLSDKISLWNILLSIFSTATVIIASFLAIIQLKESTKSREVSTFVAITEFLQKEEIRAARQIILSMTDSVPTVKPLKDWTHEEEEAAQKVLYSFDLIGLMIKQKILDVSYVVNWDYSIKKSIENTTEFLKDRRVKRGGEGYFPGIEVLRKHFIT